MPRTWANGIQLEYEDTGGDEPPMVLIMGIGTQLIHWPDGFVDGLVQRGYRVIRFDNRDAGKSTWLNRRVPIRPLMMRAMLGLPIEAPYTLWDMADDTVALLDELHIASAHVVGISMGGMIAQSVAIQSPDRVRTLTSLASTPTSLFISQPRALAALLGPTPRSAEQAARRGVEVFRVIGSPGFFRDEADIADRSARAWERAHNPAGFARQMAAILASGSRQRALRSVRTPTLVIHGAADPLIPPEMGRMTADAVPGARLRMIDGLGHDLPPGAWPQLIDEIAAHARSKENT